MFKYDSDGYTIDCDNGDFILGEGSPYLNHLRKQYTEYVFSTYSDEVEQFEHWGNVGEMLRYGAKYILPQWKKEHPNEAASK